MRENNPGSRRNILLLTPLFGICVFVALYIVAALLYPGGSKLEKQAKGFSLLHNYWCDLFDRITPNGMVNPGRPVAIAAMLVLTASFGLLWYLLPRLFDWKSRRQKIIQSAGIGSMVITAFLFTSYHEAVINLGGLLGGLALTLTFIELYRAGKKRLFMVGVMCSILSVINYFIYETGILLPLLAGTQKLTFLLFFGWAGLINIELYQKELVYSQRRVV